MAEFIIVPMRNGKRAIKHVESGEVIDYLTDEQEEAGAVKVGDETVTFPKRKELQKTHDAIVKSKTGADVVTGITGPGIKEPEVREPTMLEDIWEFGKDYYAPLLTGIGGTGGAIVGSMAGPLGTIAGGAIGAGLGRTMAGYGMDEPGEKIVTEALTDAGLSAAFDVGTLGAGKVFGMAKKPLGKLLTPAAKELEAGVWTFLQQHPELKATAAQLRQSRVGNFLENILEFGTKRDMNEEHQQLFREVTSGYTNDLGPEVASKFLKETVTEGMQRKTAQINSIWTDLKNIAKQTKYQYKTSIPGAPITIKGITTNIPVAKSVMVEAPVDISGSKAMAQGLLDRINRAGGVDDAFKGAVAEIERFVKSANVVPLEEALALKHITGVRGFRDFLDTIETGAYKRLNRAMNNDIANSFMDPKFKYSNPTELVKKYMEGNAATRSLHEIYEDIPEVNKLLNTPASGKREMSAILKDGSKIDALIKGAAKPEQTRQILKEEFLKEVFEKAGIRQDQFTRETMLNELTSLKNKHAIEKLFKNKTELAEIMRLAKTIKHFDPSVPSAGAAALVFHGLGLGAAVGGGVILNALTNKDFVSPGVAIPGLSLGLFLGSGTLIRKLLLNPETARLVADLAKLPPKSAAAQMKTTKILQALKFSTVMLTRADGSILGPGTINGDGKIIISDQAKKPPTGSSK